MAAASAGLPSPLRNGEISGVSATANSTPPTRAMPRQMRILKRNVLRMPWVSPEPWNWAVKMPAPAVAPKMQRLNTNSS